jgi:peptide/nickel transport system substrate-binding protein
MTKLHRRFPPLLDTLRVVAHDNTLAQHAIDEWQAARITRRELLRHLSVIGLSLAAGGHTAAALAQPAAPGAATPSAAGSARPGGVIRVALLTPTGVVDPLTVTDPPSVALINQTSDYLIDDDGETLMLRPSLALSWKPNAKGDVWTFKLRENVRFHDGHPFTAKDVVATFDRLADPKSGSAAASTLKGVLSKAGTRALDDHTVEFHLDAPNGNFPYYVSSDNYNAAIVSAAATQGYEKTFNGTGPFKLETFLPKQGAAFVRNPDYWGNKALPERVQFTFYADQQAQILALQGRQADVMPNFTIQGGLGLLNNPAFKVQAIRSSGHRQLHMRCDGGPFKDKRVRQALALSIEREVIVRGLFRGKASLGNDSPFAPVFASTNTSVPQRRQSIAQARQLLAQAGVPNGFPVTLTTEKFMEIPDYAVVVQNAAKAIGIQISLKVETQGQYYGAGTPGKSDWLDAPLGITDYGHRGVPNVFLGAPLLSDGAWNAARFRNAAYDKLYAQYVGALDIGSQRKIAGEIETLLLDETPLIIPYFYDALVATGAHVSGVRFSAISQLYLDRATITA